MFQSGNSVPRTTGTQGCWVRAVEITSALPCTRVHSQDTWPEPNCCPCLRQTCQPAQAAGKGQTCLAAVSRRDCLPQSIASWIVAKSQRFHTCLWAQKNVNSQLMRPEACSAQLAEQLLNYCFACNDFLYICYGTSSGIFSQLGAGHSGAVMHRHGCRLHQGTSTRRCTPAGVGCTIVGSGLSHCISTLGGLHETGVLNIPTKISSRGALDNTST